MSTVVQDILFHYVTGNNNNKDKHLIETLSADESDISGALFASICVIQNLVWLVASFGDNLVYSATVGFMNGFVFLVLAGIAVLGIVLLG